MKLIDLSKVPVPDIIHALDFEESFEALKVALIAIDSEYEKVLSLESEPIVKLLQVFAYREMYLVSKINDATRANMLASSSGKDLDAIAARYNIQRMVIVEPDSSVNPPLTAVLESDQSLRRRVQLSFDGLNTAGSYDSYIYHALSASPDVKDAVAISPDPCVVDLYILSNSGNGTPDEHLINKVVDYFSADEQSNSLSRIRPIGDRLTVHAANVVSFDLTASVLMKEGPDSGVVIARINSNLDQYLHDAHMLGEGVARSGLHAALHVEGVRRVTITSPVSDLPPITNGAYWCSSRSVGVTNE